MGKTSDILRQLADMIDDGCFEHLSEDDLDGAKRVLMALLDVDVTYDQAAKIAGKSKQSIWSKISRSVIKPKLLRRTIKYSEVVKIGNGTI